MFCYLLPSYIPLSFSLLFFYSCTAAGRLDIKGKQKAEAEPDTDHEQCQRNVGAPADSQHQGITSYIFVSADLLRVILFSFSQEGRTGSCPLKVDGYSGDIDTYSYKKQLLFNFTTCQRRPTVQTVILFPSRSVLLSRQRDFPSRMANLSKWVENCFGKCMKYFPC